MERVREVPELVEDGVGVEQDSSIDMRQLFNPQVIVLIHFHRPEFGGGCPYCGGDVFA
jgi:hypothetical protein